MNIIEVEAYDDEKLDKEGQVVMMPGIDDIFWREGTFYIDRERANLPDRQQPAILTGNISFYIDRVRANLPDRQQTAILTGNITLYVDRERANLHDRQQPAILTGKRTFI